MVPLPPDPYKALGVSPKMDIKEIKTVYRKLVLTCHPDKFPNLSKEEKAVKEEEFQRVQQAWEIVGNEAKRKEYDDDVRLRKLREEVYKSSPHPSATRPSPKNYYDFNVNVRSTDPPPSFKPGPPPASPYSPYGHSSPKFSSSWEREIPTRSSKPVYEEERKARRTASYEKPPRREEGERRRAKDEDWGRDPREVREREKRQAEREAREAREIRDAREARKREKERDERDRREKLAEQELRERAIKAEQKRMKKEAEKTRDKERDKTRRVEQQDKYQSKRSAYVEHHDSSDEDVRSFMKKKSSSSSKKHADTPTREKSSRKERSSDLPVEEKMSTTMAQAAVYMEAARRKGSKSSASPYPEPMYSAQYPNPDEVFFNKRAAESPRSRRPSQDEKKFTATVEEETEDEDDPRVAARSFKPPPLQKAQTMTSSKGAPSPRGPPTLSRAQTMPTERYSPPEVPAAPPPELARHYSKHSGSDSRRRRGSYDYIEEEPAAPSRPEPRSRASSSQKVYTIADDGYGRRRAQSSRYVPVDEIYYETMPTSRAAGFDKVRISPGYSHVYESKHYRPDDVIESQYGTYASAY